MISPARVSVVAVSSVPAAGLVWRRPAGAWTLTVVCRATFVLEPGRAVLAPVQHLPVAGDRGYPDGSSRGLYAPSDRVPVKPRADVVVVWSRAPRPPGGRLAVGEIDKRGEASSFEPVAATEPVRAALLGRAPAGGRRPDDWEGRVVPEDLDAAYFNAAPRDQQLDGLRGDERILLGNLHPAHAELVTCLPGLRPFAIVERTALAPARLALRADTLWIDGSRGIAAVVWRGQVPLERGVDLRVLVDVEIPAASPLGVPEEPRVSVRRPSPFQETVGVAPGPRAESTPLPFLASGPAPARGPSVGGGLPFLAPASAAVSPWARGRISVPREEPPPDKRVGPSQRVIDAAPTPTEAIQLLWLDPKCPARVRREPRFKPVLAAIDELPLDPILDDPDGPGDLADREDRRDSLRDPDARSGHRPGGHDERAGRRRGRLDCPARRPGRGGDSASSSTSWRPSRRRFSAATSVAEPQVGKLTALAQAFLGAPCMAFGPAVAAALTARIRAAVIAAAPEKQRPIVAGDLDAEVKRGLLDAQAFQRRRLFGAPHVRALWEAEGSSIGDGPPVPVYLPEALAGALPRAERLRVRVLAFVHPAIDEDEGSAVALRAVAVALVMTPLQA